MNVEQGKRVVIVGTVGTCTIAAIDQARKGSVPSVRIAAGGFISGALLLGLAEVAPSLAASFAALVLVTSMFVFGGGAWSAISGITRQTPQT